MTCGWLVAEMGRRSFFRHARGVTRPDKGIGRRCRAKARGNVSGAVEEENEVAGIAEGDFQDAGRVIEDAEHADDWRGVDRFAESFVVEADVAARDGRAERGAGFGNA